MKTQLLSGILVGSIAVLASTDQANAVDIRYQTSGDWFKTVAADGFGWESPGLPGSGDNARANWGGNTITLGGNAGTVNNLQLGVDESGTLEVNNGGTITTVLDVLAGNNNAAATGTLTVNNGGFVDVGRILWAANNNSTGIININAGGQVDVASHMWLGVTGLATINISGTLQQNGGILGLGTLNASTASGGTAIVNIFDGGLMALNNIHGGGLSIFGSSYIDINGSGQLTVPGDLVGALTNYANANQIGGNGVLGMSNLQIDLTTNPGFTTVTTIPEPSITLLGMLGAGFILRRRRSTH